MHARNADGRSRLCLFGCDLALDEISHYRVCPKLKEALSLAGFADIPECIWDFSCDDHNLKRAAMCHLTYHHVRFSSPGTACLIEWIGETAREFHWP